MATREIPRTFEHICDGCGAKHVQDANSRPAHWSNLRIGRDAYDFQGCAVADASIDRLLCQSCSERVFKAVNAALTVT